MKKLNEALIVLDADVESAEDCIRLAGEMFEKNGYVNAGYADAVVEREKEYPTGLPGKGINIAIPHTNNKLVNEPGSWSDHSEKGSDIQYDGNEREQVGMRSDFTISGKGFASADWHVKENDVNHSGW